MVSQLQGTSLPGKDWITHWAGRWCLLSCSFFGGQYTRSIEGELGVRLSTAVFVSRKEYSVCYLGKDELREFGSAVAQKVVDDEKIGFTWCSELKKQTDAITEIAGRLGEKEGIAAAGIARKA